MKRLVFALLWILSLPLSLCAQSYSTILHGKLSVSAAIDSTADRSGFTILSVEKTETKLDTLGLGTTDNEGRFAFPINATDKGVYPVFVVRSGKVLAQSDMVIAGEDSARAEIRLPVATGRFFIRSQENAAWLAFTNTRAQYEKDLLEAVRKDSTSVQDLRTLTQFNADMLWNLDQTFPPQSVAVLLAKAESVVKLMGWNDSLAVARGKSLAYDIPGYVEVARAVRRGVSRLSGQEAAIQYLKMAQENMNSSEKFATLQTEIIQARIDSLQQTEALAEVKAMLAAYPQGTWHDWAKLAEYEVSLLMPGLFAPDFLLTYQDKNQAVKRFQLTEHRGKVVVLEFWAPTSKGYIDQAPQLEALTPQLKDKPLTWMSFSIDQSVENNNTFLTGRTMPGTPVILPNSDLLVKYNVRAVPLWVLIDKEGKIVKKYVGVQYPAMVEELKKQLAKPYTAPQATPRSNAQRNSNRNATRPRNNGNRRRN